MSAARARTRGRRRARLVAGAAVVAAAAGGAAWLWLRPPAPRPPRTGPVVRAVFVAPDTARIGEPVRVTFRVRTPAGHSVAFAARPADDSLWSWRSWETAPPEDAADGVRHRLRAVGLPFRTGRVALPAPAFRLRDAAGRSSTGAFGRPAVFVRSVLPPGQPRPEIRGLKPPLEPPWWARVPWWALAAVAALAALAWWWWRWRKRRAAAAPAATAAAAAEDPTPAHVAALAALDALAAERLPEQGRWYEHQSRLTAIVRRFLERRFGSPQPGYTTRELCLHLAWRGVGGGEVERLRALLRVADLAKFARSDPGLETARRHEGEARALVLAWAAPAAESAGGAAADAGGDSPPARAG